MSCGAYRSMILAQNSEIYVWGDNDFEQIGN
jgi:alpha-tubulin suppressor-like RCC1 family protein